MTAISTVLEDVNATRRFSQGPTTTTFLTAAVGGHPLDGVLDERFAPDGRIAEATLFLRAYGALRVAIGRMQSALAQDPLPARVGDSSRLPRCPALQDPAIPRRVPRSVRGVRRGGDRGHLLLSCQIAERHREVTVTTVATREAWVPQVDRLVSAYRAIGVRSAAFTELRDRAPLRLAQVTVRWTLADVMGRSIYDFEASYSLADHGAMACGSRPSHTTKRALRLRASRLLRAGSPMPSITDAAPRTRSTGRHEIVVLFADLLLHLLDARAAALGLGPSRRPTELPLPPERWQRMRTAGHQMENQGWQEIVFERSVTQAVSCQRVADP